MLVLTTNPLHGTGSDATADGPGFHRCLKKNRQYLVPKNKPEVTSPRVDQDFTDVLRRTVNILDQKNKPNSRQ